jgi:hypothetical protein
MGRRTRRRADDSIQEAGLVGAADRERPAPCCQQEAAGGAGRCRAAGTCPAVAAAAKDTCPAVAGTSERPERARERRTPWIINNGGGGAEARGGGPVEVRQALDSAAPEWSTGTAGPAAAGWA